MSMSAEVDASIADSLSTRNGVAGFPFVQLGVFAFSFLLRFSRILSR
jgi:hypothetical protein